MKYRFSMKNDLYKQLLAQVREMCQSEIIDILLIEAEIRVKAIIASNCPVPNQMDYLVSKTARRLILNEMRQRFNDLKKWTLIHLQRKLVFQIREIGIYERDDGQYHRYYWMDSLGAQKIVVEDGWKYSHYDKEMGD
jgi:hypothetical protein